MQLDEKITPVIFKALCDENRVKILNFLQGGEQCACKLLESLNISQPTLSHHMKILTDSGIVIGRKDGKWTHYSLSKQGIDAAIHCLNILKSYSSTGDCCCSKKPCC